MRNILILAAIAAFITTLSSCGKTPVHVNKWYPTPPKIDGDTKEWGNPLEQPAKQSSFQYQISNDEEFLYVCVRIPDKYAQSQIIQLGMKIWFDTLSKNRDKFGIEYPLALTKEQMEEVGKASKGDPLEFEQIYGNYCQEFDLLGLAEESIRVSNLTSKDMKVAADFDDLRALVLEYKLPLKRIYKRKLNYDEEFAVTIKINELKQNNEDQAGMFQDPNANRITQSNPLMGGTGYGNYGYTSPYGRPGSNTMRPPRQSSYAPSVKILTKLTKEKTEEESTEE